MRRDDQVVVHRVLPEIADIVGEPAALGTDRMLLPRLRIVDIGDQHVVLRVGRARHRRRHEVLHDEFEISALADQLLLVAVLVPGHRAPQALLVDEGEEILQVLAVMQVEEFGGALRVVARQRMGGDVVDPLVADPDDAAVIRAHSRYCSPVRSTPIPRPGAARLLSSNLRRRVSRSPPAATDACQLRARGLAYPSAAA